MVARVLIIIVVVPTPPQWTNIKPTAELFEVIIIETFNADSRYRREADARQGRSVIQRQGDQQCVARLSKELVNHCVLQSSQNWGLLLGKTAPANHNVEWSFIGGAAQQEPVSQK